MKPSSIPLPLIAMAMMVLMNCPALNALDQAQGNTGFDAYAKQLAKIANPLRDAGDLDPLMAAIGERRLVLLGESTHGTREFYEWRAAITRRLIEEYNFSFIAVEGDWNAFVPVNRYVKGLPGAPESARAALMAFDRWPRWMWANAEVRELVEWLKNYNDDRSGDEKVGIYGMDIYGAAGSLEKGPRHMREIDENAAEKMAAAFACFSPYVDNPRRYIQAFASRYVNCEGDIRAVIDDLKARKKDYSRENRKAWLHAKQNAAIVYRAEKHYRMMINRDFSSWNARARNFYETITRLEHYYGENAGGVAWAHNTHIGDTRATASGPAMENVGLNARTARGRENVFIVGFGTHRGAVTASRSWEGEREVMTIPKAVRGSLEDVMHRMNLPAALFISKEAENIDAAGRFIGHRAIGVTYDPKNEAGNYVPTVWGDRYDAFIFIDETSPLDPLQ